MALESVTTTTTVSTVPSGTKIAADALAGGEIVQYVKSVDGRANSELVIPGDATYGWYQNLVGVGGNAVAVNSGNKSDGTLRVVIASDQPAVPVSGTFWQATQPISAASLPLPSGAATSAKQSDGSMKTQIVDGSGNVIGATSNALDVNIKSGASSGTQYAEGATAATITGTAVMWEDTSDTLRSVSAAKPLPVNVVSGGSSGTQYTEDVAAAADPIGNMLIARRRDTLSVTEVGATGRNIALNSTSKGELYTRNLPLEALLPAGIGPNIGIGSLSTIIGINQGDFVTVATNTTYPLTNLGVGYNGSGFGFAAIQIAGGAWTATLKLQGTIDTVNWTDIPLHNGTTIVTSVTAPGFFSANLSGFTSFRVNCTAYSSGSPTVNATATFGPGPITLPLPTGANTIGAVNVNGTVPVSGTFWQATQPVSISGNQAVNVAQINGVTTLMGNGVTGTGSQRVTIASDNTPFAVKTDQTTHGTTDLVAADITKIGGNAILAGTGNTGTGSPRVTLATDQASLPNWGHGGLAATAPASAALQGLLGRVALPTPVTSGQLVAAMADFFGRMVVLPQAPRDLVADTTTTLSGTTTETTIVGATASVFHDLTAIVVTNTSSATDTRVDFRDTTAGTVRFSLNVPAKQTVGMVLQVPRPQGAVNTNWTAQCATSTTDIRIFAQYVSNR